MAEPGDPSATKKGAKAGSISFGLKADADSETRQALRYSMSSPVQQLTRGLANLVGVAGLGAVIYGALKSSQTVNTMMSTIFQILGTFVDILSIQFLPIFLEVTKGLTGALSGFADFMKGGGTTGFTQFFITAGKVIIDGIMQGLSAFAGELPAILSGIGEFLVGALSKFLDFLSDPKIINQFIGLALSFVGTVISKLWPVLLAGAGLIVSAHAIGGMIAASAILNPAGAFLMSSYFLMGGVTMFGAGLIGMVGTGMVGGSGGPQGGNQVSSAGGFGGYGFGGVG